MGSSQRNHFGHLYFKVLIVLISMTLITAYEWPPLQYQHGYDAAYANYAPLHDHEHYSYPKYQFEYGVHDPHTGDIKKQHEERDGDTVRGYYSLVEPDGSTRIVEYTADDKHGFQAIVKKIGNSVHPPPVYHQPYAPSPVVIPTVAHPYYDEPLYNPYHATRKLPERVNPYYRPTYSSAEDSGNLGERPYENSGYYYDHEPTGITPYVPMYSTYGSDEISASPGFSPLGEQHYEQSDDYYDYPGNSLKRSTNQQTATNLKIMTVPENVPVREETIKDTEIENFIVHQNRKENEDSPKRVRKSPIPIFFARIH